MFFINKIRDFIWTPKTRKQIIFDNLDLLFKETVFKYDYYLDNLHIFLKNEGIIAVTTLPSKVLLIAYSNGTLKANDHTYVFRPPIFDMIAISDEEIIINTTKIQRWNFITGTLLNSFNTRCQSLVLLPNQRILTIGLLKVKIWNYEGKRISTIRSHETKSCMDLSHLKKNNLTHNSSITFVYKNGDHMIYNTIYTHRGIHTYATGICNNIHNKCIITDDYRDKFILNKYGYTVKQTFILSSGNIAMLFDEYIRLFNPTSQEFIYEVRFINIITANILPDDTLIFVTNDRLIHLCNFNACKVVGIVAKSLSNTEIFIKLKLLHS